MGPEASLHSYILETEDISAGLAAIHTHGQQQRAAVRDMLTQQLPEGRYRITFRAEIGGIRGKKRRTRFLESLAADPAVVSLRICTGDEAPVL